MESKLVWTPHQEDGFQLGHIVDLGAETFTVQPLAKGSKPLQAVIDRVFPAEEFAKDVEDNCSLLYLNEATLLNNLRMRFKKKIIYTYVANILLSLNPYELYKNLYSPETMRTYQGVSLGLRPPHVFAIADKAYREMKGYRASQAIIVSGESGAGKTEATKYILRYLTELYGESSSHIEERIVQANPLLESFGNAKTMRNNNSSRFGKFVEVHFNEKCQIVGGHISHYLLEKSRVVSQWNEERNYHVFYRLLAGAPSSLKKTLGLDKPPKKGFSYLNPASLKCSGVDDTADFKNLVQSMKSVGLSDKEQGDIFRLVSAVLWMGNISFEEDSSGKQTISRVDKQGQEALTYTADLLQLAPEDLHTSLTSRVMTTTRGGAMGTIYQVPLKKEQAAYARDALAKTLYTRLFDKLVERVNTCFPFQSSHNYIGVLDIAGFEYFQVNSFEQFCINYCNEKLQQFFNRRVLKDEQELYRREMLSFTDVEFTDNQDCIDLIEASPIGIISLLDEQCKLPQASDVNFTDRVQKEHNTHFRLLVPRKSKLIAHRNLRDEEGIIIRHFAGAVCYSTKGFIDKNNDALHDSLEQLMLESKDSMIRGLVADNVDKKVTGKLIFISIGANFRRQLSKLMDKLYSTGSSFIRCIKPNSYMKPGEFQGGSILSQLQCAGMVSVLELMQGGYPSRANFNDLYNMYKGLLPPKLQRLQPRLFCEALFRALGMLPSDYAFGMSKVFFKPGKFALFDQIMHSDPDNLNKLIAKVEHWLIRKRWKKLIFGAISVLKLAKKIQFRNEHAVIIQKWVRMFLAVRKHRPRYLGIKKIGLLRRQLDQMSGIVGNLKENKDKFSAEIDGIQIAIGVTIQLIRDTPNLGRSMIEQKYKELQSMAEGKLGELLEQEVKQKEKDEAERLRKIQEEMELERKLREAEEARRLAEEEEREQRRQEEETERVLRQELEERRRLEEEQRKKIEESMAAELAKLSLLEAEEDAIRRQQEEQERMDYELACRIAEVEATTTSGGDVIETQSIAMESRLARKTLKRGANIKAKQQDSSAKKFDLRKWKYAELRDTINTSCEIELLNACREEFHRRLRVYNAWKMKNKRRDTPGGSDPNETQRAPQDIMQIAEQSGKAGGPPPLPQRTVSIIEDQKQRYFKIPFIRPSDQSKKGYRKKGWWLAHFDGQWIARQMELHPDKQAILLVAGVDDLEMCELSLDETRLAQKPGAEVLEKDFETVWAKYGGKNYTRPIQRAKDAATN